MFIPRREVMFKLMRSCIGIKRIQDLWIYQKPPHKAGAHVKKGAMMFKTMTMSPKNESPTAKAKKEKFNSGFDYIQK